MAKIPYFCIHNSPLTDELTNAKVAQLVERDLAKVEVAGSNPVFRSTKKAPPDGAFFVSTQLVGMMPGWWNW